MGKGKGGSKSNVSGNDHALRDQLREFQEEHEKVVQQPFLRDIRDTRVESAIMPREASGCAPSERRRNLWAFYSTPTSFIFSAMGRPYCCTTCGSRVVVHSCASILAAARCADPMPVAIAYELPPSPPSSVWSRLRRLF